MKTRAYVIAVPTTLYVWVRAAENLEEAFELAYETVDEDIYSKPAASGTLLKAETDFEGMREAPEREIWGRGE